ncbi:protein argonaute-2-like [Oppia nitens]|uniref:protein argonaute-2-like n=1 Tax=Oppia nitens TaxID=1686743 RepID=UPI0023DAE467|nr:protein argonaute-2-like [Oppia nitens]
MAPRPHSLLEVSAGLTGGKPTPKTALMRSGLELKNERFLSCSQFVPRPGFGQKGRRIVLNSNHFAVDFNHKKVIYRYLVTIERLPQAFKLSASGDERRRFRKLSESMCHKIVKKAIDENQSYAKLFYNTTPVYDGSQSMFTCGPLIGVASDGKPTRILVEVTDEQAIDGQFAVIIKFTGNTISLNALKLYFDKKTNTIPFEHIQILNIVLRQGLVGSKVTIGQSLFNPAAYDKRIPIGGGKQLAYGIYQSLRPCISGAQLVVDRTCTAFWMSGSVEDFIRSMFPFKESETLMRYKWNDFERKRIERELKGLFIEVTHLRFHKKYKIHAISRESAQDIYFDFIKRGRRGEKLFEGNVSVAQYYKQEYQELKTPYLPCIVVRSGPRPTYFPLEVCKLVTDQHVKKALPSLQKAEMIRICASTQPKERFEIIEKAAKDVALNPKCLRYLNEFSVKVSTRPIGLSARVLDAPVLLEKNGKQCQPRDGKWRIGQFFKCVDVKKWIVVNLANLDDYQISNFIDTIKKYGQQMGMNVDEPLCRVKMTYQRGMLRDKLFDRAQEKYGSVELFVFLGIDSDECYYEIKKCGDIDIGLSTQCIRKQNVLRMNQSLATNILLKINTKLGGENMCVARLPPLLALKKTLVIGADVAHPSPSDKLCASVAAVVGNIDANCVKHYATVNVQHRYREEIINELDLLVNELLREYERQNGELPEEIIFYRDGVSEGQFMYVMDFEIRKIKRAFQALKVGYNPKLTFIVVQKRHHTRFIPDDEKDGVGRGKNIPPGTIVDNVVVHPTDFDFFLCSHEGIQGTSRPSHYYVLYDENRFGADELHELTYYLCHTYARCTRSVSIPSPVYYAHLAAHRARGHINGSSGDSDSGSSGGSPNVRLSKRIVPNFENLSQKINVRLDRKSSMYFC